MEDMFSTLKVILEVAALLFLPMIVWLLKTATAHGKKLVLLEEKVNAEISRRLDLMDRKIDYFDNKIETKIDRLEANLNSKIDIMTSVLSTMASNQSGKK